MDAKIDFKKGDLITAEQAMQLALQVALEGAPFVSPNPLVGCVIVDNDHRFLASGFHARYGVDHAEIAALKKLNPEEISGSTFYVTLEPCAHEGKTGSCAKKLATTKTKKVIYGIIDPNPLVSGQGAEILRQAGIEAEEYQGELKQELEQLCEIFLKNQKQKKVFVAAKVATTLDGQIAHISGESRWITSSESREYVHELRSYYDAIVVGANTVKLDNPNLTIRHPHIVKQSQVIILDPENLLFFQKLKVFESHPKENIIFAVKKRNPQNSHLQIEFESLTELMEKLWDQKIHSVFIEGGAHTYSTFLAAGLVDRLYLFMAPAILGSGSGLSWTNNLEVESLSKKIDVR